MVIIGNKFRTFDYKSKNFVFKSRDPLTLGNDFKTYSMNFSSFKTT